MQAQWALDPGLTGGNAGFGYNAPLDSRIFLAGMRVRLLLECLLPWPGQGVFALCLAGLLCCGLPAQAASLGRLTVHSGAGQLLNAEIEILVSPAEKGAFLLVELASQEDFQNAGIAYAPELRTLQLSLVQQENGAPVLRLSSSRPLQVPSLSFLLALRWPGGRQVREFTFSLAPGVPPTAASGNPAPGPLAAVSVLEPGAAAPPVATVVPASMPAAVEAGGREPPPVRSRGRKLPEAAPSSALSAAAPVRRVRPGETLYRIALEAKPAHIQVEQMLLALYRRNPEAFLGGNLNRLRAGAVLQMPDEATLSEMTPDDVRKIVAGHHYAWNQYRQVLVN